jgi:predicted dienelactone hydrolase
VVVLLQHPGSDRRLLGELTTRELMTSLQTKSWDQESRDRLLDVDFLLNALPEWQANPNHFLSSTMDLDRIALGGHSYGAVTTQTLIGQRFPDAEAYLEPRLKAAILMSPSPGRILEPRDAFGHIHRPVLCLSGSEDRSPLRRSVSPTYRELVYESLPAGCAYQAIFEGAQHGDWITENFQSSSHKEMVQVKAGKLVVNFLDAHLRQDQNALARLQTKRSDFSFKDRWNWK